jgi:DNA-binding transcriptional MerR regulator
MSLTNKKYFSIAEVEEITGIPAYKLRYLEKSSLKLEIVQIRGRRYYTVSDIELIKQKFSVADKIPSALEPQQHKHNSDIISQIDFLIAKLVQLEERVRFI